MSQSITIRLKGGLGNQMFQYAAARSAAQQLNGTLLLDTVTGFARDRVYRRTYELHALNVEASVARPLRYMPFWFERLWDRVHLPRRGRAHRPWGLILHEPSVAELDSLCRRRTARSIWLEGYFQDPAYFATCRGLIARELTPPAPRAPKFLEMAERLRAPDAICVGLRLFEEVPAAERGAVGGVTPLSFYEDAAAKIARSTRTEPKFYVFCVDEASIVGKLRLPGAIHYISHGLGYTGAISRLWLMAQGRKHIIANSSFYWWAAWLACQSGASERIIASNMFSNHNTVPKEWLG